MAERRAKGLCFNCDDLYGPGHAYKAVLFYIRPLLEGENMDDEPFDDEDINLSLNAMKGEQTESTLQVKADIATGTGWTLLDTGITHNFIQSSVAEKLGIPIRRRPGRFVSLADGGKCVIDGLCKDLPMMVQGHKFTVDCFAIPLSGFDVVLDTLIKWHGEAEERKDHNSNLNSIQNDTLEDWFNNGEEIFITGEKTLPPQRACDHRIRLIQGANPIAVRPYRYPHLLKNALSEAPILALPDFSQEFVVECDASGSGIGAVIHQRDHPIACFSRQLAARHHKLAAYERELIGLAKVVIHWRSYLWGRRFLIRTDHYCLKFLLEQRLSTSPQIHWISKLLGFDFGVEFRDGKHNKAADALSRRDEEDHAGQCEMYALKGPDTSIFGRLRGEIERDAKLATLQDKVICGELTKDWVVKDGLIFYKGRVYLSSGSELVGEVVS
ncbi:PREDICTED: uncharacterized protein LOC109131577 [Camelina sativa]|uniref:Uncharacterized protein LOC109131577 n=1 Tax=Camelina sativa TaxID=90675 RepID=A0ABM1RGV5_CAMSA|nr:PREDICTED: uncharacterized protein LOC109131577 [Camelina sativa]